jgi:hypothetical protein
VQAASSSGLIQPSTARFTQLLAGLVAQVTDSANSPRRQIRRLGKRVEGNPSGTRTSYPPPPLTSADIGPAYQAGWPFRCLVSVCPPGQIDQAHHVAAAMAEALELKVTPNAEPGVLSPHGGAQLGLAVVAASDNRPT